jgi:hypothetical protein
MTFWTLMMVLLIGFWRLQDWRQRGFLIFVTLLVLFISQTLFVQLSITAGLSPGEVFLAPERFLATGPAGWLALLVMPVGWLGPFLGINFLHRMESW